MSVKKNINDMKVVIKLASPKQIEEWSNGEVKDNDTLNYRTLKPETGGIFCAKIFGPVNNYECLCGRYKGIRYNGIVCEKCGVKIANSMIRRENMGHIQLPVKVVHKWFFRTTNNKIALLIDLPSKELKRLANLERYIVFKPGSSPYKVNEFINESDYELYMDDEGFHAETGAEALYILLKEINLEEKINKLSHLLNNSNSPVGTKRYHNILSLCKNMLKSDIRPEWMILDKIAVMPVDLRPLDELSTGQFVSADINELYKTIIYRSNRLKSLQEVKINIPLILHNEIRILQNSVNKLLYTDSTVSTKEADKHKRSIEDRLKGKTGLMRSLLGKRVDFSARTVIVAAAFLKLDEVILPKEIILELLTPALIGYLRSYGLASTTKQAKAIIERREEIWDIVKEIIETKFPVVLLNRAPTLHRVSIMAFKIKLWDHKAIGLHPLVCGAFNADFDGDQMAIHLPLSEEAKTEALMLMLPSKNFGSVTHGGLIVNASKDIVFGLYHLTRDNTDKSGEILTFGSMREIEYALAYNQVDVNSAIKFYNDGKYYDTTVGRVIFWNIIPTCSLTFDDVNKSISSKIIQNINATVRNDCGSDVLSVFVDESKDLGFKYSNYFTGSLGLNDFFDVPGTDEIVEDGIKKHIQYHEQMEEGFMTEAEMHNRSVELWSTITQKGHELIKATLAKSGTEDSVPANGSAAKIINSGARGSIEQLSQMIFMKGNVVGIDNKISTYPIWTGFKKGLQMYHYFQANRGSRRACTDVALKTAEAGYLTRRLVDVAHSAIINMEDCGTENFLLAKHIYKDCILQSLVFDRVVGRVCAKDIILNDKIIVKKGELINNEIVQKLKNNNITEIPIRSVALCNNIYGICAMCYGSDISTGKMVNLGEAVGVIAAQSIGEPATQLNMRAFHFGGIAKFGSIETGAKTPFAGKVQMINEKSLVVGNQKINISRDMKIMILNEHNMMLADFSVPYGANIFVENNQYVNEGDSVASWKPDLPIIAEFNGTCRFINVVLGTNCETIIDDNTGQYQLSIIKNSLSAFVHMVGDNGEEVQYYLPEGTILVVNNGMELKAGTIIAYIKHKITTVNIMGGLQSVQNILENSHPKNPAILSHIDGEIVIMKNKKKNIIIVQGENHEKREYIIKDQGLIVQQGQKIKRGDRLTSGSIVMQDLLDTHDINTLIETMCFEMSNIYMQQGIKINDKHLEVIISKMCCYHEVTKANDSGLIEGQKIHVINLYKHNLTLEGRTPAETKVIINGITDAALYSTSFLSSASFQETLNILVEAGLKGDTDYLLGLKENIIAGTLIPAGTGYAQKIFQSHTDLIQESKYIES